MLIPFRSDADVERWPWATIGLVAANLLAFVLMYGCAVDPRRIDARIAAAADEVVAAMKPTLQARAAAKTDGEKPALAAPVDEDDDLPGDDPSLPMDQRLHRLRASIIAQADRDDIGAQLRLEDWAMRHGGGLTPVAWFTSAFAHAGILHLLGNMAFLWVFGVIIESRMRWGGFLALYMALTGAIGLLQQSVISEREWSLGASSSISALMAMAWAWQPRGRVECLLWIGFGRARVVEWPVWAICLLFLGCDALFAWLQGWRLSTPMLHATGAAVGAAVGVGALLWSGGSRPAVAAASRAVAGGARVSAASATRAAASRAVDEVRRLLAAGDAAGAAAAATNALPAAERDQLIDALVAAGRDDLARPHLDRAARDPAADPRHRLRLASLVLDDDPRGALALLQDVETTRIDSAQRAWRQQAIAHAREVLAQASALRAPTEVDDTPAEAGTRALRTLQRRRLAESDAAQPTAGRPAQPTTTRSQQPATTRTPQPSATRPPQPTTTRAAQRPPPPPEPAHAVSPTSAPPARPPAPTSPVAPVAKLDAGGLPVLDASGLPVLTAAPVTAATASAPRPFAEIDAAYAAGRWDAVRARVESAATRTGADGAGARLRLARATLEIDHLAGKALRLLDAVDPTQLDAFDRTELQRVVAAARVLIGGSTGRVVR